LTNIHTATTRLDLASTALQDLSVRPEGCRLFYLYILLSSLFAKVPTQTQVQVHCQCRHIRHYYLYATSD
ncbi:hypothetical protein Tco_0507406, partial [Tanacetum coccineum]